mgnify:CR=1 FL=1
MGKNLFGAELFFDGPRKKPARAERPVKKSYGARRQWTSPESPLDKVEPFTIRPVSGHTSRGREALRVVA